MTEMDAGQVPMASPAWLLVIIPGSTSLFRAWCSLLLTHLLELLKTKATQRGSFVVSQTGRETAWSPHVVTVKTCLPIWDEALSAR